MNSENRIREILHEIANHIDEGRAAEAAIHFADDGVMEFSESAPNSGQLTGIDTIRGFFEERQNNKEYQAHHKQYLRDKEAHRYLHHQLCIYRLSRQGE